MEIIKLRNVIKKFGDYAAVNDVSFDVHDSGIFGILGPNGAGKTTTIRMITNIYMPDSGTLTINDEPVGPRHQNIIGYLPEERGLYKKIKVLDQLSYFAQLKGVPKQQATERARFWLNKMDAADWEQKKVQELSKGMQQKVQFIATILHDPDILIFDEPFSGFDPLNVELLKSIILDLKNQGKTILLSTHVMEQVEKMCDDICLINKGKIILSGKVRDIKRSFGKDTILMEFDGDSSFLNEFTGIQFINKSANRAEFRLKDNDLTPEQFLRKAVEKVDIYKFELAEPGLNEIFIDVVSKQGENDEE